MSSRSAKRVGRSLLESHLLNIRVDARHRLRDVNGGPSKSHEFIISKKRSRQRLRPSSTDHIFAAVD